MMTKYWIAGLLTGRLPKQFSSTLRPVVGFSSQDATRAQSRALETKLHLESRL